MARRPQRLDEIFQEIAGTTLWLPNTPNHDTPLGPTFTIYAKHSELTEPQDETATRDHYWTLLQESPTPSTIGIFATVNNLLSQAAQDPRAHDILNTRFLDPKTQAQLAQRTPPGRAFTIVFNRLGNLAIIRNLALYAHPDHANPEPPLTRIGDLALCANDFLQQEPDTTHPPTTLDLVQHAIATWDLNNPRDLAYTLTRMHTILTHILPGTDPTITRLRTRLGLDHPTVDTLPLPHFVAILFALYAYGNQITQHGPERTIFHPNHLLKDFPQAQPLLDTFLDHRALTLTALADQLAHPAPRTRDQFTADLADLTTLMRSLHTFQRYPLLRLDDERIIILDLQFLADLLTTGTYWTLFDTLPAKNRDAFRELWGRALELYTTDLLHDAYPPQANILTVDLPYDDGQIDALLDFGPDVFIFEIKASLLTETAKRTNNRDALRQDIERKFIRNERGNPKAVLQLARSATAIANGTLPTTMPPNRIYPILVSDEPACECFGFNAHLNERFQQERGNTPSIRPLTVLSINELEEFLPYTQANDCSWADLCDERFNHNDVHVISVHQALHDIRAKRKLGTRRNDHLLQRFTTIYDTMLRTYGPPAKTP